jgi:hypothetical protein
VPDPEDLRILALSQIFEIPPVSILQAMRNAETFTSKALIYAQFRTVLDKNIETVPMAFDNTRK